VAVNQPGTTTMPSEGSRCSSELNRRALIINVPSRFGSSIPYAA
jgi:hypothetical protein